MLVNLLLAFSGGAIAAAAAAVVLPRLLRRIPSSGYREAFLALVEPVLIVAPDGRVLEANEAAATLLGEPQPRGRPLLGVAPQLEVARRSSGGRPARRPLEGDLAGFEVSLGHVGGAAGRVRATVMILHDERRDREHARRLQEDAFRDALTGIANRRGFEVLFAGALERRGDAAVGIVYIDLDGFKAINDTLGHAAGDAVLATVAKRLSSILREGDTVARLGGDEFAIMLPGITPSGLASIPGRVASALGKPIPTEATQVEVGASIGLASAPRDGTRIDTLLQAADQRMYRQKHAKDERDPRLTSEQPIGGATAT